MRITAILLFPAIAVCSGTVCVAEKPNIIVILADDK